MGTDSTGCPQKPVRAQDVGRDTEDPLGMRTQSSLSSIHVDYSDLEENAYKAFAVYKRSFSSSFFRPLAWSHSELF
jgi:hypothetical protein